MFDNLSAAYFSFYLFAVHKIIQIFHFATDFWRNRQMVKINPFA